MNAATDSRRTVLGHEVTLPAAVRVGAGALWIASAVWTTVSVHHVIGNWTTSGVVTAVIESAYGLATIWFHSGRTRLSTAALIVALVPVVAALAYADHDMFGPVGFAFAAGPIIAEAGFLLAAHLSLDPAALTVEQQRALADIRREAADRAARREAQLAAELEDIKAEAKRQMALDAAEAEVLLQRGDLARRLSLSARTGQTDTVPALSAGHSDKVSAQVKAAVSGVRPVVTVSVPDTSEGQTDKAADTGRTDTRLSVVGGRKATGLSAAFRDALADNPGISNADLVAAVEAATGQKANPASVARTRLRAEGRSA